MTELFSVSKIAGIELSNRIIVSPMSQYSAEEGSPTEWHHIHYGSLANSGAALVMVESTHVSADARGTLGCLGIYNDEHEHKLSRIVAAAHRFGSSRIGLQLNHSGRKASSTLPWESVKGAIGEGLGWQTVSASAEPFGQGWPMPRMATTADLAAITDNYAASAARALRAGFDTLEIHAAHGYLLHSFLSPLTNHRDDEYGGSLEARMKFPLEVLEAVRKVWPTEKPLSVRVSSTDWDPAGWSMDDSVTFVQRLKDAGCDYVCMSSGGTSASTKVPIAPGYQTGFAARIKKSIGVPVSALGLITDAEDAQRIVVDEDADFVTLGRAFLDNPHWAWQASARLGASIQRPRQYQRATPGVWPGAARADLAGSGRAITP